MVDFSAYELPVETSITDLKKICFDLHRKCGPDTSVGIATGYERRSGDRIPVGGEIFRTCPDRPRSPTSLLYIGYRVFPGGKEWPGRETDPSPLVVKKA